MTTPSAKLLVLVGEKFACVKISGRANFTSSIDFKTLLSELQAKGYTYFVLDLTDCVLMDSTFLGVLAGFGLKAGSTADGTGESSIELYRPNARITDLLENLGVLHLFKLSADELNLPGQAATHTPTPCNPTREEVTRACLEAHKTLMEINPGNVARFKDVTQFLAEDLKKLKAR